MKESPMTPEYAILSMKVGFLASKIDEFLGKPYFINLCRDNRWSLTEELVDQWLNELKEKGVPIERTKLSDEETDFISRIVDNPEVVQHLLNIQELHDMSLK